MAHREPLMFMPLDLDTFVGSERFMTGQELGSAFNAGMRAYLAAQYGEAVEQFKAALIAAYADGSRQAVIGERERAIIYLYIGNACAFSEDWPAALREYLEAAQTDPQLSEAHYNMGVAFAATGQFERAVTALKEALEHDAGLYEAHFALGRCYQRLSDNVRAYIHYASARELRPQAGEPLYYMGLMHQSQGATELAQRSFAEALRVEPTFVSPDDAPPELVSKSDAEVAQWYYRLSEDLKGQSYEAEAERIYRALLDWRPRETRARYLLGNLLARTRRLEEAVHEYLFIPPADPYYIVAQLRIAAVLRLSKRLKQAYHILYECARLRPTEGQIFMQMGKLLYDLEKPHAAAQALERATRLLAGDSVAHYLLGFMYLVIGKDTWAITAWRRAIALTPQAFSLRYDLACIYIRKLRHDLAAKELTQVLEHRPEDMGTRFLLGLCFKEMLEPGRAISLFETVLKHQPQNTQALYYIGACYLQTGNTTLGRAYLRQYDRLMTRSGRPQRLPHQALPSAQRSLS